MKSVNINFVGFWKNFDYQTFLPYQLLSKHYDVQISDNPDVLFCSIFGGFSYCKYNCLRIFCTSECYFPDMNLFDYAISITNQSVGDRIVQIPYFLYIPNILDLNNRPLLAKEDVDSKARFCNFIYSHPAEKRDQIFKTISTYKHVDSAGSHLNNMNGFTPGKRNEVTGIDNTPKLKFQGLYKFSIACENEVYEDYITEKIIHAYMARTIPIYYGDTNVCKIFNPNSFINVSDFKSDDELLKRIEEIDNDVDLFLQIINEPIFVKQTYLSSQIQKLDNFLCSIIENGNYRRRPNNYSTTNLNNVLEMIDEEKSDIVMRIYRRVKRVFI